jgi:hypothetical protein
VLAVKATVPVCTIRARFELVSPKDRPMQKRVDIYDAVARGPRGNACSDCVTWFEKSNVFCGWRVKRWLLCIVFSTLVATIALGVPFVIYAVRFGQVPPCGLAEATYANNANNVKDPNNAVISKPSVACAKKNGYLVGGCCSGTCTCTGCQPNAWLSAAQVALDCETYNLATDVCMKAKCKCW